jgi:CubicO group peptidase (beta-lactamase class C family)
MSLMTVFRIERLVAILVLVSMAISPAGAETVDGIEETWRAWMSRHGRTTGGLAVVHGGVLARAAAMGRDAASTPVSVASLSKAVTGVCVAGLIERGRLAFETPLSQALSRTMARVGQPADPRLSAVTISQLLVHRAGFAPKKDIVNAPLADYLRNHTARRTAFDSQLRWIFRHKLASEPGTRYAYSNAGYLILGAVIEEASGRDYEGYCRETVLLPLGARDAALDPAWRIMSSYGGWRMPTADYARFYQAFAPGNPAIGPQARAWMMSPEGKRVGGGVHYGLGTFVRPTPTGGGKFWHWGAWTYSLRGAYDGTLDASYSAFAVRLGEIDTNMMVHVAPRLGKGGGQGNLDRTLGSAAQAVRNWR